MIGNRKLLVTVLAITTAFVLACIGRLTGDFVTVVSIAAGGFFAANTFGDHRAQEVGRTRGVRAGEEG